MVLVFRKTKDPKPQKLNYPTESQRALTKKILKCMLNDANLYHWLHTIMYGPETLVQALYWWINVG